MGTTTSETYAAKRPIRAGLQVKVDAAVWVPLWAMGLVGVFGRETFSAQGVDLVGHDFKVMRVDTCAVPAKVVKRHPIRHVTKEHQPRDTMSKGDKTTGDPEAPIAGRMNESLPRPTLMSKADPNLAPKACLYHRSHRG